MKIKIFLTVIGLLLSVVLFSQQIDIKGKILDASTDQTVPFANIAIADIFKGTSSNMNGEFLLKLDSLPVKLIISHISYEKKIIDITSFDYITIELTPGKLLLEEVVIKDKEKGEFAYDLLTRAFTRALNKSRDWQYGLAFYRQTSENANDYSELYEIFFDTRYTSQGIVDWAIQEGRYAMKTDQIATDFVFNKNFTLLSRLVTTFQPDAINFLMPVNVYVRDFYDVDITELRNVSGRKIAIVSCTLKKDVHQPALEGVVYIDIDQYDILRIHGFIRNDKLDIINLVNPKGSWKNYELETDISFKTENDQLYLDYITLNQTFDYYINDQYSHQVKTNAFLTYYEYYQPDKFKRLGGRIIRYSKSDRELLDKIGYNRRFWEENPVVLRTPIEENIISSFEAKNAFGTIYLNDREQIQLEKDDLSSDPFIQEILIGLKNSKLATSGEKVYIHMDKPFYAAGETIWFNANIVNLGSLIPSDVSGVLYVELISPEGEVALHKRLSVVNSRAEGSMVIPRESGTGIYRIRSYTDWMKNYDPAFFFDQKQEIFNTSEILNDNYPKPAKSIDFDIKFFPEGGNLVTGIPSQVAFKATDIQGKGIEVKGKIIDDQNNQVAEILTRHDGMGSFFYLPQPGRKCKAIVSYEKNEKIINLPEPVPQGYVLTVNNLKDKNIQIIIKATPEYNDAIFYLIGQMRGVLYHREKGTISRGNAIITIPKAKLPAGVFHITLFDTRILPLCERLVFIDPAQEISVSIKPGNSLPLSRDPISINMDVKDDFGNPIRNTSFSIAITDANHINKKSSQENILTNLLLTSDLKGYIEDPGYYFLNDDRETKIALDLVMLTHGWRRFTWHQIFDGSISEIRYAHEPGIHLSGSAFLAGSKKPLANGFLNLISLNEDLPGYWQTTTNPNGKFDLRGMIVQDTLRVMVKSLNSDWDIVDAELHFDSLTPYPTQQEFFQKYPAMIDKEIINYLNHIQEQELIASSFDFEDRVLLKEIVIKGDRYNTLYGKPDYQIEFNEKNRVGVTVLDLIRGRFPGVYIAGNDIQVRGVGSINASTEPLFIIDGIPISGVRRSVTTNEEGETIIVTTGQRGVDIINTIPVSSVERIEFSIRPTNTSIYGTRGANGVIAIFTNSGLSKDDLDQSNYPISYTRLQGFSVIKEFYHPDYSKTSESHVIPDKRTTLYWNPSLKTDNLGKCNLMFYNSDNAKNLQVEIQGVTDYGEPFYLLDALGKEISQ